MSPTGRRIFVVVVAVILFSTRGKTKREKKKDRMKESNEMLFRYF